MTCIQCRKADLEPRKTDIAAEVKGESVLVKQMDALVCPGCGYTTIHGSQMPEYMRLAADVYRRKHSLLTSEQIVSKRELLDMTQERFAAHVGVGPASIKRWELGQVQDRAMDNLIKLRTDPEEAHRNLKEVEAFFTPRGYWMNRDKLLWNFAGGHEWKKSIKFEASKYGRSGC